ncbi:hypothetical protein GH146_02250 [archaeon]|jgi:predicted RNA binding protein YcfA (HicA-like mRNA interferase family)|nr:hypothetical protein [archaeon]
MTSIKKIKVIKSLKKKGFCVSEGDHKHLVFFNDGKKTMIRTKVSQGGREIDDWLINLMSLQTKLEKKQFIDLINCPMSSIDYLKEMQKKGFV